MTAFTNNIEDGISPIEYKDPCHHGIKIRENPENRSKKFFSNLNTLIIITKNINWRIYTHKKFAILATIKFSVDIHPITLPNDEIGPEVISTL